MRFSGTGLFVESSTSMTLRNNSPTHPATLKPRTKIWLEVDGQSIFCRGLRDMLLAVDETGSIKEGAARVGRSYRFVWARIKQAEAALGSTLVKTQVGGKGTQRSELTEVARNLISAFDELRERVFVLVDEVFQKRIRPTLRTQRPTRPK